MTQKFKLIPAAAFAVLVPAFLALALYINTPAQAADNNVSNGITVDSTLDTPDDNVGDNICDDGDGNCTLRAAIEEANSDPDATTISFNITGTADFTNSGQDGYTIAPATELPDITETVTINGYSQPGSRANTAIAPYPLNGVLLIEIDGSNMTKGMSLYAQAIELHGLVLNRFITTAIIIGADDSIIQGNYLGVDPTGLLRRSNQINGINGGPSGFDQADNAIIGGVNPSERNIISGNADAGVTPNTGNDGWVVKGNYIGMGADGVTPINNSYVSGPGALSIDNCANTVVGGSELGATNLISGNASFGIFPDNTINLRIQGNIIGPDYKGEPVVNNTQLGGIGLPAAYGPFIGTLIGGTGSGDGNLIAHNKGVGISVITPYLNGVIGFESDKITILGNSIHSNIVGSGYPLSLSGMGIDLLTAEYSDGSLVNSGPTPNDPSDSDTGPNGYINFPVLNTVTQSGNQAIINYNLDAADSPTDQYRIEFFANDTADPSGYGEGQTFLGAITTTNGANKQASITLPTNINLAGKSIAATTTAIDNTSSTGFGSTSEFSQVVAAAATTNSASLASTGSNNTVYMLLVALIVSSSISAVIYTHRFSR